MCLFSDLLIQDAEHELVRVERGKKLLGKQSYVSDSETNYLSAGQLWFWSLVFTKLEVSPFKYHFNFVFSQTSQAIRRIGEDGGEERGMKRKASRSLLGSETSQVTSPVSQLSLL